MVSFAAPRVSRASSWIMAARPKTLPAAAAPVLIGCGLALHRDVFSALPAAAAMVGALLIQIATNLANDYGDFRRGIDTAERVGPTRVTHSGLLSAETVRRGMLVTLGAAGAVGVYLVWVAGWPVAIIGIAALASAVGYTLGPFPLAHHGLGDVFVFVFFGLVAVAGTYYVQAHDLTAESLLAGAGVGALSTAILVVNNLRDIPTDALAGKRTLAVRIGRRGSQAEYTLLLIVAACVPLAGVGFFAWPPSVLLALLALLTALSPLRRVLTFDAPLELLPALGQTARAVAVYGLLMLLGFAWQP